jgi:cupin 2 domain-containing protein
LDQAWDEWVLVIRGAAEIVLADEDAPRVLIPGDYLFIPAHVRHRVMFTDPNQPTVWLAIHIDSAVCKTGSPSTCVVVPSLKRDLCSDGDAMEDR